MYFLEPMICHECGKRFIPAPQHVYKNHKGNLVCSWHCVNADYKKRQQRKQEARERAEQRRKEYDGSKYANKKMRSNGVEIKRKPRYVKPVDVYTKDGKFIAHYPTLSAAAQGTGYSAGTISEVCNGDYEINGDYTFKFAKRNTEGESVND
jgi:hypothetical protein